MRERWREKKKIRAGGEDGEDDDDDEDSLARMEGAKGQINLSKHYLQRVSEPAGERT